MGGAATEVVTEVTSPEKAEHLRGHEFYAERASDKFLVLNSGRILGGDAVFGAFSLLLSLLVQKIPKVVVVIPTRIQPSTSHLIQCISPPHRHCGVPSGNDYKQNRLLWEWCKSFRLSRKVRDMRANLPVDRGV